MDDCEQLTDLVNLGYSKPLARRALRETVNYTLFLLYIHPSIYYLEF